LLLRLPEILHLLLGLGFKLIKSAQMKAFKIIVLDYGAGEKCIFCHPREGGDLIISISSGFLPSQE
jgi:hypothetical protein